MTVLKLLSDGPDWIDGLDLGGLIADAKRAAAGGEVNDFIPALGRVPRNKFGIAIHDSAGRAIFSEGDVTEPFSVQSISKLLALILLMNGAPDVLWKRVNANASLAERFDSIAGLELSRGIPTNPFLNAGALVMTDLLLTISEDPLELTGHLLADLIGADLNVNFEVAASEIESADRNRALAYYLRSHRNLENRIDDVIRTYCELCAIEMTCVDLARLATVIASSGSGAANPKSLRALDWSRLRDVTAKAGLYGESLDMSDRYGITAKSGSGGGILAALPNGFGVGVWSPPLSFGGNSAAGMSILRQLGRSMHPAG